MAVDPLVTVQRNWTRRIAMAPQLGLDPTHVRQVANQDLNAVKTGGKPMTREQAWVSLQALQGGGANPLAKQRPTGILGTLENVVPDIASTLWNFPKGVAHLVANLPQEAQQTVKDIAHPASGGLGAELRQLDDPKGLLGLIPGLDVAAKLTTGQGRSDLQQHPVGALLDVLPIFAEGTAAVAKAADVGNLGDVASQVAEADSAAKAGTEAPALSAKMVQRKAVEQIASQDPVAGALLEGKPLKAAIQAVQPLRDARSALLEKLQATPAHLEAYRKIGGIKQTANRALRAIQRHSADWAKTMTEEQAAHLLDLAQGLEGGKIDWANLSADDRVNLEHIREIQDSIRSAGEASGKYVTPLTLGDAKLTYANTGAGARIARNIERSAGADSAIVEARATADRVRSRFDGYAQTHDAVAEAHKAQAQATLDRYQPRLDAAQARLEALQAKYQARGVNHEIQPEYLKAKTALDNLTAKRDQAAARWTARAQAREAKAAALRDHPTVARSAKSIDKAIAKAHQVNHQLLSDFLKTVPDQFKPQVEAEVRAAIQTELTGRYAGSPQLEQAMTDFATGGNMAKWFGDQKTWDAFYRKATAEARNSWVKMVQTSGSPLWVHSAAEADLERIARPITAGTTIHNAGVFRERALDLSPSSRSIVALLTDAQRQVLEADTTERVVNEVILPHALTHDQVHAEALAEAQKMKLSPTQTLPGAVDQIMRDRFVQVSNADLGGLQSPRLQTVANQRLYLDKNLADGIKAVIKPDAPSKLGRINMGANRVFKTAVMAFSPTHLLHIWLGGMMGMMLRGDWHAFLPDVLQRTASILKDPTLMHEGVSTSLDIMRNEDIVNYIEGKQTGRLLQALHGPAKVAEFTRGLSEMGQNFYRAWLYSTEEYKALGEGITKEEASLRAMEATNKAFVDLNSMLPIERQVAKQIFPFYTFTSYAMRFVLSYPVDHPIRASILTHLGEIQAKDTAAHGLPNTLAMLFDFGAPDAKGNVWGTNLRAMNPYRDTATNFTKAGLFRQLFPAARGVLEASGFNTLDGSPDPYNTLAIDPNTGQLVAQPKGKGGPLAFAEAFVPELGTVDHFLGLSGQMRQLKQANPQAFRKQLFQALNVPFVPQQTNLPQLQAAAARRSLRVEQQDVAASWKALAPISGYSTITVPSTVKRLFGGRTLVSPAEWNSVIEQLAALKRKGIRRVGGITLP
jgi:hypothetical protein